MNHELNMMAAIQVAKESKQSFKCGAVIVKNGRIISAWCNQQRELDDASAHAEILAIRDAGKILQDKNLANCAIYCTCEPCVMCLAAICYTKIEDVYFGVRLNDIIDPLNLIQIDLEFFLKKAYREIRVHEGLLKEEILQTLY